MANTFSRGIVKEEGLSDTNIEEVSIIAILSFIFEHRQITEMKATRVRIERIIKAARK